eukprot:CAMPEP_0115029666 /NCGR_PEP_ID=MMETSP0216-20121206/37164_1 /TAXON_ID=223996 /ORGANISM="Protocruzia adherens, Strain Boccale" /LENGTH=344 /DNA_ID=CAMNT_0002406349 /DNA_START=163 /DNA_END=1197 /DNA_ORIENTATION=-
MKRTKPSFTPQSDYQPAKKLPKCIDQSEDDKSAIDDGKAKTPGITAAKKAIARSNKTPEQLNAELLLFYRDIQKIANGETPEQESITDESTDLTQIAKAGLLPRSSGEVAVPDKRKVAEDVEARNEKVINERTFSEKPVIKKKRKSRFAPVEESANNSGGDDLENTANGASKINDDIDVALMTDAHRRRLMEMSATASKAQEVTDRNEGKRHLLQYLPQDELKKWNNDVAKYKQTGQIRDDPNAQHKNVYNMTTQEPAESSVGHKMLYKSSASDPSDHNEAILVTQNVTALGKTTAGKNVENDADGLFQAYRQRMMMAYKHRPNPLNNPRRTYDGYDTGFQGLQ